MKTIKDFVIENNIKMDLDPLGTNPWMEDSNNMNNYDVTLGRGRKYLSTHFSTGLGWTHDPDIEDVLSCLASDAAGIANSLNFDAWCGEYGYDTDSHRAERLYKVCKREAKKLENFLGYDLYHELLWEVERE